MWGMTLAPFLDPKHVQSLALANVPAKPADTAIHSTEG